MRQERFTGRSQQDPAAVADEQLLGQLRLQAVYLLADGRLRDRDPLGCLVKLRSSATARK
jgi:hypothetical protein